MAEVSIGDADEVLGILFVVLGAEAAALVIAAHQDAELGRLAIGIGRIALGQRHDQRASRGSLLMDYGDDLPLDRTEPK